MVCNLFSVLLSAAPQTSLNFFKVTVIIDLGGDELRFFRISSTGVRTTLEPREILSKIQHGVDACAIQ